LAQGLFDDGRSALQCDRSSNVRHAPWRQAISDRFGEKPTDAMRWTAIVDYSIITVR
jgi:hypothetical protein